MFRTAVFALLGAASLAFAAPRAGATTLFSNDFSNGVSPVETLIGNFTVQDGDMGHHSGYTNNEYSSYRIVLDLHGYTDAFLDFDYYVQTQHIFDILNVYANDTLVAGFNGYGASHTHVALGALTDPGVIGRSTIAFDFTSDFAVTDFGIRIDNVVVSAVAIPAPVEVPEPASWAVAAVGLGLVGLGRLARSRLPGVL